MADQNLVLKVIKDKDELEFERIKKAVETHSSSGGINKRLIDSAMIPRGSSEIQGLMYSFGVIDQPICLPLSSAVSIYFNDASCMAEEVLVIYRLQVVILWYEALAIRVFCISSVRSARKNSIAGTVIGDQAAGLTFMARCYQCGLFGLTSLMSELQSTGALFDSHD